MGNLVKKIRKQMKEKRKKKNERKVNHY